MNHLNSVDTHDQAAMRCGDWREDTVDGQLVDPTMRPQYGKTNRCALTTSSARGEGPFSASTPESNREWNGVRAPGVGASKEAGDRARCDGLLEPEFEKIEDLRVGVVRSAMLCAGRGKIPHPQR